MDGRQRTAGRGCFEKVTVNVFFGVRTDIYLSFFCIFIPTNLGYTYFVIICYTSDIFFLLVIY